MKAKNKKLNIVVFYGGYSNEREVSLSSGSEVIKYLDKKKYNVFPKKLSNDRKKIVNEVLDGAKNADLAFIALHGEFGEDGKIQSILDTLKIPYTASGELASALAMNKSITEQILKKEGVLMTNRIKFKNGHVNDKKISYPCVVKPNDSGSSVGVSIVKSKKDLKKALKIASKESKEILIEKYIKGREFACAVLGNAGDKLDVMPVIEILTKEKFFNYKAKYSSGTTEICPAKIDKKISKEIQKISKLAHEKLGCKGLTRSDFIVSENNKVYFLETNTTPGMTPQSLAPKEAGAMGVSFSKLLDKMIKLALQK